MLCECFFVNMSLCHPQEEQAAKAKAEKIRVALEKIKEAQVKKVSQNHCESLNPPQGSVNLLCVLHDAALHTL